MICQSARTCRRLAALRSDARGVSAIEFALSLPFLLSISLYGMEAAHLAYCSQVVSDIAVQAADSVARVRTAISEGDVTEVLGGVKTVGTKIGFAPNGRIIVSSLQPIMTGNTVTNQKIRWQRCSGRLAQNSSYGVAGDLLGTSGMGPTGRKIAAAANTEVIVVEIRYDYEPLVSASLFGPRVLTGIGAMVVRDRTANDLNATGTASSCSVYAP